MILHFEWMYHIALAFHSRFIRIGLTLYWCCIDISFTFHSRFIGIPCTFDSHSVHVWFAFAFDSHIVFAFHSRFIRMPFTFHLPFVLHRFTIHIPFTIHVHSIHLASRFIHNSFAFHLFHFPHSIHSLEYTLIDPFHIGFPHFTFHFHISHFTCTFHFHIRIMRIQFSHSISFRTPFPFTRIQTFPHFIRILFLIRIAFTFHSHLIHFFFIRI